jgi:hypothetical protein
MESADSFQLKRCSFLGRDLVILCQNENGPCPLLAICKILVYLVCATARRFRCDLVCVSACLPVRPIGNCLLLRGHIEIHSDFASVGADHLVQLVANRILEINDLVRVTRSCVSPCSPTRVCSADENQQ